MNDNKKETKSDNEIQIEKEPVKSEEQEHKNVKRESSDTVPLKLFDATHYNYQAWIERQRIEFSDQIDRQRNEFWEQIGKEKEQCNKVVKSKSKSFLILAIIFAIFIFSTIGSIVYGVNRITTMVYDFMAEYDLDFGNTSFKQDVQTGNANIIGNDGDISNGEAVVEDKDLQSNK